MVEGGICLILRTSCWRVAPCISMLTTAASAKGLIDLPEAIRRALPPVLAETRSEDVTGCLAYDGRSRSLEEMEEGIVVEATWRHAGC